MKMSVEERFWAKVDKSGGPDACWPWTGSRNHFGHGRFNPQGRLVVASRWIWERARGPIPSGMLVCHKCDNPPCCNPGHLFLGTHQDNMADKVAKGRQACKARLGDYAARGDRNGMRLHPERAAAGERNGTAKLTSEQVVAIRSMVAGGLSQRDVGNLFGVHQMTVSRIVRRKIWKHISPASTLPTSDEPYTPTLTP